MIDALIDDRIPIQIPMSFGKYNYVNKIGSGSFSVVILCEHIKTHQQFACKIVSRDLLVAEKTFDRFEQEVRIMQTLQHPNIVRVEEIVYEEKLIFVVMEYCQRGDLFNYIIKNGTLTDYVIKKIFRQVVEAIKYLHERHLAHRDIKPENILINNAGNAKLGDFGLCHLTSPQKLLTTPCGSPLYAPPEIISGTPYDGLKSDMWSLGVVLFTMCTGSLPWAQTNQSKLLQQIQDAEYVIPLSVSPVFRDLIEKLMEPNPNLRPTAEQISQMPFLHEIPKLNVSLPIARRKRGQKQRSYSFGEDQPITDISSDNSNNNNEDRKEMTSSYFKKKLIVRPEISKRKNLASSVELKPVMSYVRKVPTNSLFATGRLEPVYD